MRLPPLRLPLRRARAFTLVELLFAAGITALIAGFIAVIVMNISTTWSRASVRLGADAQARIILDQLQTDLQGAMYRDDGNAWFAVDVLNGSSGGATGLWRAAARNPKPVGSLSLDMTANRPEIPVERRGRIDEARFGTAGVWLRFFTSSRGANNTRNLATVSAPVAVGYQIIRRFTATNPANQNTAYLLHRAEARPATVNGRIGVLEAGYNIVSANYTTSTASTNSGGITGDPRGLQVPGSVRNLDSVFADNVIDFGVRCYVRDPSLPGGLRLTFPATSGGALSNSATARLRGSLASDTPVSQWGSAQPFPDVVDVMVRILTEHGVGMIADLEKVQTPALSVPLKYNSNAQQWWWGVALENSRVYTRRIVLQGDSL